MSTISPPLLRENHLSETLSLNGTWEIESGGKNGQIQVPGVWEVQGYPPEIESVIYRRQVVVPDKWVGARIMLCFGALSYAVVVTVNDVEIGTHRGLWTPFEFDVTAALRVGEENRIVLEIVKPGFEHWHYRDVLVGFIPYASTTFGGPWQDVWLAAHRAPAFHSLHVRPDGETGTVQVSVQIDAPAESLLLEIADTSGSVVVRVQAAIEDCRAVGMLDVKQPVLWSPASPVCYTLSVYLTKAGQVVSKTTRTFGFRHLQSEGERLLLNGQPIFIRGILSWGWNPETLAPTPSEAQIRDEFKRVRAMGFNMIKLCLFVPPPRLFEIADEAGMLLWLELPMWQQRLSESFRQQASQEYEAVFAQVHHHPSIVIYSLGCELGVEMADSALLEALNATARRAVSGALVCDNSGSGEAYKGLDYDFADFNDYHFYCDLHYFMPLLDHFRRDWRPARPWLFGEFCDCDDYRDPEALMDDPTFPWWRELLGVEGNLDRWAYRDQMERMQTLNLPFTHQQIEEISREQSLLVRKTILERVRMRREVGGYVVTGLRDTPISTSGLFDDFGQAKYDAGRFRQFNADAVLLLEVGRARAWRHGGDQPAPIDPFNHIAGTQVSHRILYAGPAREAGSLHWRLVDDADQIVDQGLIQTTELPGGSAQQIGVIEWTAPDLTQGAKKLVLSVDMHDVNNQWPMWVYPKPRLIFDDIMIADPVGQLEPLRAYSEHEFTTGADTRKVLVASVFNPELEAFVHAGGRALLLQSGGVFTNPLPFWRESIKLLYGHPLLDAFPHDGFTDMQFYALASDCALNTARLPVGEIRPIIRRLDARLFTIADYLVELRIGAGTLIVSTLNFCGGTGDQPRGLEANVVGQYLLGLILDYLRTGILNENERHSH